MVTPPATTEPAGPTRARPGAGASLDSGERIIATVERAVALLGALAESPRDMGTNELSRLTGINASSVSRVLATLVRSDFVRKVPDSGRYRLGLRLVQLGNAALARVDLREAARPHLLALARATGETATLSIPGEHTTMTVDYVQSQSSVRSVAEIGRPSVPHATATGKVYLAHGGRLAAGTLTAYTARTVTDRQALERELDTVRDTGWAKAVGEREEDLHAVAAPVLDGRGALVAVLGLQGPAARFDEAAMSTAVQALLGHAGALSGGVAG